MKYICTICGYVYDEATGIPNDGIPPGTRWTQLLDDWVCPLCGAAKSLFVPEQSASIQTQKGNVNETMVWSFPNSQKKGVYAGNPFSGSKTVSIAIEDIAFHKSMHEMSFGELSALCSGLANSCERQYLFPEAQQFNLLADYYRARTPSPSEVSVDKLLAMQERELSEIYTRADSAAETANDRGAKRILKWSKAVVRATGAILKRYKSQGDGFLKNSGVYICEVCGYIQTGDAMPHVCPVCRAPDSRISKVV